MPNWCRGYMTLKGTKDNLKRFLLENLKGEDLEIFEDDKRLIISSSKERILIEGTIRNFILEDIELYFDTDEMIKKYSINEFMAAWGIDPEPYVQMSRVYEIDFHIHGSEIYGGFNQEIKIQKGEVIIDKVEEMNRDFRDGVGDFIDREPSSYMEDLSRNQELIIDAIMSLLEE